MQSHDNVFLLIVIKMTLVAYVHDQLQPLTTTHGLTNSTVGLD